MVPTRMVARSGKEAIPAIFSSFSSFVKGQVAMYRCVGELVSTGDLLLEGNMYATDSLQQSNVQTPSQLGTFARHPKDPTPPWVS